MPPTKCRIQDSGRKSTGLARPSSLGVLCGPGHSARVVSSKASGHRVRVGTPWPAGSSSQGQAAPAPGVVGAAVHLGVWRARPLPLGPHPLSSPSVGVGLGSSCPHPRGWCWHQGQGCQAPGSLQGEGGVIVPGRGAVRREGPARLPCPLEALAQGCV